MTTPSTVDRPPFSVPTDRDYAHHAWGANCGPCALAALLGVQLAVVRPHLGRFESNRYMSPTDMKAALSSLGIVPQRISGRDPWPRCGLAFVQWSGSWDHDSVAEQYRHTHWIATRDGWLFDVNAFGWIRRPQWEQDLVPEITQQHAGADGGWWIRTSYEIELVAPGGGL